MTEGQLVEAAKAGDRRSFEELLEPHMRGLRSLTYRMIGYREDARDLLQESWCGHGGELTAFAVIPDFAPGSSRSRHVCAWTIFARRSDGVGKRRLRRSVNAERARACDKRFSRRLLTHHLYSMFTSISLSVLLASPVQYLLRKRLL